MWTGIHYSSPIWLVTMLSTNLKKKTQQSEVSNSTVVNIPYEVQFFVHRTITVNHFHSPPPLLTHSPLEKEFIETFYIQNVDLETCNTV